MIEALALDAAIFKTSAKKLAETYFSNDENSGCCSLLK